MSNPVTEWLNSQQENMVKLLADLVTVSYTHLTLPTNRDV